MFGVKTNSLNNNRNAIDAQIPNVVRELQTHKHRGKKIQNTRAMVTVATNN